MIVTLDVCSCMYVRSMFVCAYIRTYCTCMHYDTHQSNDLQLNEVESRYMEETTELQSQISMLGVKIQKMTFENQKKLEDQYLKMEVSFGPIICCTVEHSYNKPEIPGQTVCYKQEFVISEQFPMRYCSTWLRSLLCYSKKFIIEEFVIRVLHCMLHLYASTYV